MSEVVVFVFKARVHEAKVVALVSLDDVSPFFISRFDAKWSEHVVEFVAVAYTNLGIDVATYDDFIAMRYVIREGGIKLIVEFFVVFIPGLVH